MTTNTTTETCCFCGASTKYSSYKLPRVALMLISKGEVVGEYQHTIGSSESIEDYMHTFSLWLCEECNDKFAKIIKKGEAVEALKDIGLDEGGIKAGTIGETQEWFGGKDVLDDQREKEREFIKSRLLDYNRLEASDRDMMNHKKYLDCELVKQIAEHFNMIGESEDA